jgi:hypothetical protein
LNHIFIDYFPAGKHTTQLANGNRTPTIQREFKKKVKEEINGEYENYHYYSLYFPKRKYNIFFFQASTGGIYN